MRQTPGFETTAAAPYETAIPTQREQRLSFESAVARVRRDMGEQARVVRHTMNGRQCATITRSAARPGARSARRQWAERQLRELARRRHLQALDDLRKVQLDLAAAGISTRGR